MHNIVAPHKSLKLYAGRDLTAAAEGNRTNSYIFSDSSLYLRINPAITATQGPNLIDMKILGKFLGQNWGKFLDQNWGQFLGMLA